MRISESKSGFYAKTSSPRFLNEEGFVDPEIENIDEEALAELDIEDDFEDRFRSEQEDSFNWSE